MGTAQNQSILLFKATMADYNTKRDKSMPLLFPKCYFHKCTEQFPFRVIKCQSGHIDYHWGAGVSICTPEHLIFQWSCDLWSNSELSSFLNSRHWRTVKQQNKMGIFDSHTMQGHWGFSDQSEMLSLHSYAPLLFPFALRYCTEGNSLLLSLNV